MMRLGFTGMLYICQFAIATLNKPSQWFGAQVCYVAGITGRSYLDLCTLWRRLC